MYYISIHEGINVNYKYYLFGKFRKEKLVISCHTHKFKHLNFNYIYRICYKNAKKANPLKWVCPY
jgi:hypothetical protein